MKTLFKLTVILILSIHASYASSQFKSNALVQAVLENNAQKIRTLLETGEDVNQLAGNGETILCAASMMNKYEAAKVLIDNGADLQDNCLILAVANGNANVVKLFLDKGKNADTIANQNDDRLLHIAIRANYIEVTDILLKNGANKDIKNKDGLTPSDLIAQERKILDQLTDLLKQY